MGDYQDYTTLMQIIGSDIMVPIDIQGAYIMMPVDIQAQYITLEIDIVAQSIGAIAIDLAAQSVGEITVNIAAQDLENLNISINAQNVGIYSQPEWSALEGTDKNFFAAEVGKAQGTSTAISYEVPAGKTLFITHFGGSIAANDPNNSDLNQTCYAFIYNYTDNIFLAVGGGNGGFFAAFNKPIAIAAGKTVLVSIFNEVNHSCNLRISASGFEV